jgi:hypothetical protein
MSTDIQESWDKSGTDGFLSQWALGLSAREERMKSALEEAGGVHIFQALFDLEGNPVPAKELDGQWGRYWAVMDSWDWENGKPTGEFVSNAKKQTTYEKKGYRIGRVKAPAEIRIGGRGNGLSGAANVQVFYKQVGFGTETVHTGEGVVMVADVPRN